MAVAGTGADHVDCWGGRSIISGGNDGGDDEAES
jgi:hypothetical protein